MSASKQQTPEQRKAWLADMSRHKCGCGEPAVKLDGSKAGVCQGCLDKQSRFQMEWDRQALLRERDAKLRLCCIEVSRALDAYWTRIGVPEPKGEFNKYEHGDNEYQNNPKAYYASETGCHAL